MSVERIAVLENMLNDINGKYDILFDLGYTKLGNELLGVAEGIERIIMDLEEEAGLV